MDHLREVVATIRRDAEGWRRHALNETTTRTIIINRVLEALDWDLSDLEEVRQEYVTLDGKLVDYALCLNKKPVLLIEAKPLNDALDDVKQITQVVNYGNIAGIAWVVLTNGLRWKVYRSVEHCPAPDKLLFEVVLDAPDQTEAQASEMLSRLSRDAIARGELDAVGERVFTDGKIRKILDALLREPDTRLVNLVRQQIADKGLTKRRIAEGIVRVWQSPMGGATATSVSGAPSATAATGRASRATRQTAGRRGQKPRQLYPETLHTDGKPREVLALYKALDRFCFTLHTDGVVKVVAKKTINYCSPNGKPFCSVHLRQGGLRTWLQLKCARLNTPPSFARDVSNIGHWGAGDLELALNTMEQLTETYPLVRQSFEAVAR